MKKRIIVLKIVTGRLIIIIVLRIILPGDPHRPPGVRVAAIPLPEAQVAAIRLPGIHRLPGVQVVPPEAQ